MIERRSRERRKGFDTHRLTISPFSAQYTPSSLEAAEREWEERYLAEFSYREWLARVMIDLGINKEVIT